MGSENLGVITAVSRKNDGMDLFDKIAEHIGTGKDTPQILYIN